MSLAALSTLFGPMRLPAPRSSPAPHLDGQRALSGGTVQLGVWATTDVTANSDAATMIDFGVYALDVIDVHPVLRREPESRKDARRGGSVQAGGRRGAAI